ncbi:alpha/beta hydrolase [Sphingomonas sp. PL-96]|uniref:alpha/beta fold hydrolase n=1 Tax=Sphingomonas sp. PL-96 TaxID=2887201 RepID=UPI001E34ED9A|nr:alpha/beta fold hydrolase [Sphingomonas sp. PL-96]MCC2976544.1 alpha/beta hydrolase [Sphingomonas sp. PL-96]
MKLRRGYTDGPFGQIHFQHAAQGRPLVLLHQAIMSSDQFANVFAPLVERGLRPIAIDMPGFGASDPPAAPPTIADYATAVLPVLDSLGIDRAAVAGHHTGALVATELALAHPERITAVVLAGPMIISDAERQSGFDTLVDRERAFTALPQGRHFVEVAEIREMLAAGSVGERRISDYVVQAMQAYGHDAYWYGHYAAFSYRHDEPLARLAQPVLLLSNTGDMTHPSALAAHRLRPDFAYREIEGGGIDICDQAPEAWGYAIADFLQNHP